MGRDLKDRDRLWRGTEHLEPRTVAGTGPDRIVEFLRENAPVDVVVLDLDAGGAELLEGVETARHEGLLPSRILGYFSHVREDVGAAAAAAGVHAYPRSRFWRELPSLVEGVGN
ncbi:MAG: hypothetical protein M3N53_10430 [Actinomycetota bacterium]|nr:hypothetical protein [Actinomycetota bacterium]